MLTNTKPLTIIDLQQMKARREKISCLTAYDASFSRLLDQAGIDLILVGDTLGMIIQGHQTTVPVAIGDMVYHSRAVAAAKQRAFLVADLPFATYATPQHALENAMQLMQGGGAQMVKLEGDKCDIINFLTQQGIPVCGHLGLLPQSVNCLGGYKVQGRQQNAARKILDSAQRIEEAGAALLVLECVPATLAADISQRLTIPVIGIGAGPNCDGQVLVLYDVLGIPSVNQPRFSKNFLAEAAGVAEAVANYRLAVKSGEFPGAGHSY